MIRTHLRERLCMGLFTAFPRPPGVWMREWIHAGSYRAACAKARTISAALDMAGRSRPVASIVIDFTCTRLIATSTFFLEHRGKIWTPRFRGMSSAKRSSLAAMASASSRYGDALPSDHDGKTTEVSLRLVAKGVQKRLYGDPLMIQDSVPLQKCN